jgi:transposase
METTLRMSTKERGRLEMFSQVKCGGLTVGKAARLLGISMRQARRIWRRYCREGDAGLVHRLRGRPSNAGKERRLRQEVLDLCRRKYADFGSVLAAEHLVKDGYDISPKTLWRWRRIAGDLGPVRRGCKHRIRRERRGCVGQMVQMDGSTHDWFEGRRESCVLFVMIDDASSRLFCRFYESEDTSSAFDLFGRYVRKYGLPGSLYVDKDSIYRVNEPKAREEGRDRGQTPQTQFGRAMEQLGVEVICANSPQAKGRVERVNGTLQDRLVKALRLAGISSIEQANAFLDAEFLREHNRRFGRAAAQPTDAHRCLPAGLVLREVLCVQETRIVGRDWCVSYAGRVLQLDKRHERLHLAGRAVTVRKLASGQLQVVYKGQRLRWKEIPFKPAGPQTKAAAIEAKSAAFRHTLRPEPWRPAADHPWRRPSRVKAAPLRSDSLRSSSLRSAALTREAG